MLPRTMVPASAPATKKIQTRKIIAIEVSRKSGTCSRYANSPRASLVPAAELIAPLVWLSAWMPAAPNTENQIMEKMVGAIITPRINSRMVRPLEMRAITVIAR